MSSSIRIRDTVAMLFVIGVAALALARGISADLHVPAARIIVAECQGFEALATAGGQPMTCNAQTFASVESDTAFTHGGVDDPAIGLTRPGSAPAVARLKA